MKPERLTCPLVACYSTAHTFIYDHCHLFYTSSASTIKKTNKNSQQIQSPFFSDLNNNLTCIQLCLTKTDDFAVNFNRRQAFFTSSFSGVNTKRKITNWTQDAKAAPVISKKTSKKMFSCFRVHLQAITNSDIHFSI